MTLADLNGGEIFSPTSDRNCRYLATGEVIGNNRRCFVYRTKQQLLMSISMPIQIVQGVSDAGSSNQGRPRNRQ